ncbi:MAG: 30S ribosome-binding factor RbfA [Candidatus Eremiobacteraeota bacterium]|nr:30S ribosome-binding factor RbfA [Candidatus Eremiobacteraeota bacterium]MBV8365611.1 30S ribosome-binding factor RbfA [Candidatus Eremiobacteraeota bacterium]
MGYNIVTDGKNQRLERIEHEIVRELSELLHKELKDPRVGFVTITGAKISPDLTSARVFASPMGDARATSQTMRGLSSAAGFLSIELGKRLGLRRTPTLRFERDDSIARGVRLTTIIDEVQRADEARSRDDR